MERLIDSTESRALIDQRQPIVLAEASRRKTHRISKDELIGVGNVALVNALLGESIDLTEAEGPWVACATAFDRATLLISDD